MVIEKVEGIDYIHGNTPTHTVVKSDFRSMGITDHKGDSPTLCMVEHTDVKESTEFVDPGVDTPALDATESANKLFQRTTPHDGNAAGKYAGPLIVDATTGCEVTRTDVLLGPLPTMKELVQLRKVINDDFLHVMTLQRSSHYGRR
ncbi:hypothetical protein Plhal304r1_c020g0073171 [Plasmopara halstedii]